jgi:hypothetical protein
MLQDADEYRSWALLGFLACPAALAGVGARPALAGLLSEALVMHVYEDRVEALHPLFEQHVRPSLEKLTEVRVGQSACSGWKVCVLVDVLRWNRAGRLPLAVRREPSTSESVSPRRLLSNRLNAGHQGPGRRPHHAPGRARRRQDAGRGRVARRGGRRGARARAAAAVRLPAAAGHGGRAGGEEAVRRQ